ncbi:MAG: hypothetical protein CMN44_07975 [SAR116 cluster bacterium]|nr:hypothetical protein [SAR116 cluster bacterium]RPH08935.1 MAG: hypothetical protein CBC14_007855 [Alphaproteobacteria bacterium TMED54]|tara:strand:+ start:1317 stop:1586 length:270 start_codon:yes stop_codon:yes gene_type:complete
MFKSEEHKLDKLEQELLDIENFAKNLDLNSKDEDRMVLTNIVNAEVKNISDDEILINQPKNDLIDNLKNLKLNLESQIKEIDKIIEKNS